MRRIISSVFLIFSLLGFSQIQLKTQKIVTVLEAQSFYLNGGTRNMLGGNSRSGFIITLPPNTIEWYYTFTTEPNKNEEQNLQLENQLSFLLNTAGLSAGLLGLIKVPEGQGLIDVYLTDRKGYDNFFKKDFFGQWQYTSPGHSIEGTRTNVKNGKVQIKLTQNGQHYIVIRNTSGTTGINVKLEVVAITEETTVDLSKWSKDFKDNMYNTATKSLKNSGFSEERITQIAGCFVTKLTSNIAPNDFNELAEYEKNNLFTEYYNACQSETAPKAIISE